MIEVELVAMEKLSKEGVDWDFISAQSTARLGELMHEETKTRSRQFSFVVVRSVLSF